MVVAAVSTAGLMSLTTIVPGGQATAVQSTPLSELSIGDWRGHAQALGVTQASEGGGLIVIRGTFSASLQMTVPNQGDTMGFWDMNGQTNWTILAPNLGQGSVFMSHSANGQMAGDRSQIRLGATDIISAGTATLPEAGSFAVSSVDPIGPLDLAVAALFCDDAYGEWILSWNTLLSGARFSPTFNGNWQARRVPADDDLADRVEALMPELNNVSQRLVTAWAEAEMVDGVPVLPVEDLTELLRDAIEIVNELNTLSSCDVEYLGVDNVQQWIYSFTRAVSLVTEALTVAIESESQGFAPARLAPAPLAPADLARWSVLLASAGSIGPGSLDPEAAVNWERLDAAIQLARGAATGADSTTIEALSDQLGIDGSS